MMEYLKNIAVISALIGLAVMAWFEIEIDKSQFFSQKTAIVSVGFLRFMLFISSSELMERSIWRAIVVAGFSTALAVIVSIFGEWREWDEPSGRLIYHTINWGVYCIEFTMLLSVGSQKKGEQLSRLKRDYQLLSVAFDECKEGAIAEKEDYIKREAQMEEKIKEHEEFSLSASTEISQLQKELGEALENLDECNKLRSEILSKEASTQDLKTELIKIGKELERVQGELDLEKKRPRLPEGCISMPEEVLNPIHLGNDSYLIIDETGVPTKRRGSKQLYPNARKAQRA